MRVFKGGMMGKDLLVVYQPHLFEHCRLARLSRTKKQHLDLIPHADTITLQLLLNLLVTCPVSCACAFIGRRLTSLASGIFFD